MTDETPTAEQLRSWPTPNEVRRRAAAQLGETYAEQAVWDRVREGLIRVCAVSASQRRDYEKATLQRTPWLVSSSMWNLYKDPPDKFWTGDTRFAHEEFVEEGDPRYATAKEVFGYRVSGSLIHYITFGLRLHPEDVEREFPPVVDPSGATSLPPVKHAGGAPRKPWWDDFWIEMVCRQHAGDIQPTSSQADVAKLMLEWAEKRGHDMGDTTAKTMARKLVAALKAEVKN
ncbi:MAG: hypothetical protein AB7G08_32180 [Hyphomicrobiaceae bacterium]